MAGKRVWDNYRVLKEIPKSTNETFQVALATKGGIKYVTITEFVDSPDKEYRYTFGRGLSIPITTMLDGAIAIPASDITDAILEAIDISADFALDDPDNYVYRRSVPKDG